MSAGGQDGNGIDRLPLISADDYDSFQQYEGRVRPALEERPGFYPRRQVHGTFQVDPEVLGAPV